MSELKAYCPYANRDGFYHKSEVDKIIAEKDAKILALDAEVAKQKHHAKLFFDERNYAEIQLRRQKYKRCLAMARWCESEAYIHEHGSDYDEDLVAWFGKWYKRWIELAKKCKEAK